MSAQDNLSLEQLEAWAAKSQAELKQDRAKRRQTRKASSPTTASDWTKQQDSNSGITHHVHAPSGGSVFNTLRGTHKWQIKGTANHGEVFKSLQEAKHRVESYHQENQ